MNTSKDVMKVKDKLTFMEDFCKERKSPFRTSITAIDEFGDVLYTMEHNMVVLGGALTVLEKMWNVRSPLMVDTINNIAHIDDKAQSRTDLLPADDYVCLWGVDLGGRRIIKKKILDVKYYEREIGQNGHTTQMVPFRTVTTKLTGDEAEKYWLCKDLGNGYYAYYGKVFDSEPFIRSLYRDGAEGEDGSEVQEDVYENPKDYDIETFVEMHLKIEKTDIREWFKLNGEIEKARVNTIGLFTARKVANEGGDGYHYENVKLFSKFNFDSEPLQHAKTLMLVYRVYSA